MISPRAMPGAEQVAQPASVRRGAIPETEADLLSWVLDVAHLYGWRVAHFRPAMTQHGWRTPVQADGKGWPDFVLVHPSKTKPLLFVELKSEKGKLTPEQETWLRDLAVCPHVQVFVWRPSDREKIAEVLGA